MNSSEIIFYTTPDGNIKVEVILQDETILLTQKAMGELFDVATNTINYHLKEVFKSNELAQDSVIRKIRTTEYSVLKNAGSITADIAMKLAIKEYEKFRVKQDSEFESDFDIEVKRLKGEIN